MNILVVCAGNSGRSPVLEALLRDASGYRLEVVSAGVGVPSGSKEPGVWDPDDVDCGPHPYVVRAMRRQYGLDIGRHHVKTVQSLGELNRFDHILVMDEGLAKKAVALGADTEKVRVVAAEEGGIPDPDPSGSDLLQILERLRMEAQKFLKDPDAYSR